MKLSIIIPSFNAEKYICTCVSSIQKYNDIHKDIEIIIVDDGSTDRTLELSSKLSREDGRIKVVHQENTGLVGARKKGIQNATGDYITYIDADDYISEKWIENIIKITHEYNPDMLVCGYKETTVNQDNEITNIYEKENLFQEGLYNSEKIDLIQQKAFFAESERMYNGLIFSACVKTFKSELINRAQFEVPNSLVIGEDTYLTMIALNLCSSVYISSCSEYYYVQRTNSMIHTYKDSEFNQLDEMINLLLYKAGETEEYISYYIFSRLSSLIFKAYKNCKSIIQMTKNIRLSLKKYPNIKRISMISRPRNLAWKYKTIYYAVRLNCYFLIGIFVKKE